MIMETKLNYEELEAHGNGIFIKDNSTNIAVVTPCGDKSITESRAKLFAAAPKLLEALESLVYELTGEQECEEELEKGLGAHLLNKVLVAKYAIKKAKGE